MTTKWQVQRLWEGRTVAVLGSGPSLTRELARAVHPLPRICARWAAKFAPDADFCGAIDTFPNEGFWPWALENFKGQLWCGVETPLLPDRVKYYWHRWEMIRLGPHHLIEIRNNGMSAIHLADELGASKILKLGFDPQDPRHCYDNVVGYPGMVGNEWYGGLTAGLEQLDATLRSRGVEVVDIKTVDDLRDHLPKAAPPVEKAPPSTEHRAPPAGREKRPFFSSPPERKSP